MHYEFTTFSWSTTPEAPTDVMTNPTGALGFYFNAASVGLFDLDATMVGVDGLSGFLSHAWSLTTDTSATQKTYTSDTDSHSNFLLKVGATGDFDAGNGSKSGSINFKGFNNDGVLRESLDVSGLLAKKSKFAENPDGSSSGSSEESGNSAMKFKDGLDTTIKTDDVLAQDARTYKYSSADFFKTDGSFGNSSADKFGETFSYLDGTGKAESFKKSQEEKASRSEKGDGAINDSHSTSYSYNGSTAAGTADPNLHALKTQHTESHTNSNSNTSKADGSSSFAMSDKFSSSDSSSDTTGMKSSHKVSSSMSDKFNQNISGDSGGTFSGTDSESSTSDDGAGTKTTDNSSSSHSGTSKFIQATGVHSWSSTEKETDSSTYKTTKAELGLINQSTKSSGSSTSKYEESEGIINTALETEKGSMTASYKDNDAFGKHIASLSVTHDLTQKYSNDDNAENDTSVEVLNISKFSYSDGAQNSFSLTGKATINGTWDGTRDEFTFDPVITPTGSTFDIKSMSYGTAAYSITAKPFKVFDQMPDLVLGIPEPTDIADLFSKVAPTFKDTILIGANTIAIKSTAGASISAGADNDTVTGGTGSDTIGGGTGKDVLTGGAGNDVFVFNEALNADTNVDTIKDFDAATDKFQLDGINIFDGGQVFGENQNLIYDTATGNLSYDADGAGVDSSPILFAVLSNKPTTLSADNFTFDALPAGSSVINGTPGDDELIGTIGADTIYGSDGLDTIVGGGGNDLLDGGNGDDTITGCTENDTINGGAGNDNILGDNGTDTINGDAGDDMITAGSGNDTIDGGDGNDFIIGGGGADSINGGAGNDELLVSPLLASGDPAAVLNGGAGMDTIHGSLGGILTGGTEADIFNFDATKVGPGNTATITDFQLGVDLIDLTSFNADGLLSIAANIGTATAGAIVIYDTTTGNLYYDADGAGTGNAEIQFATLTGVVVPQLTDADFTLV